MNNCAICKAVVGCSCNLKTTSDGKRVCGSCYGPYENSLKSPKPVNTQVGSGPSNAITINSITHKIG